MVAILAYDGDGYESIIAVLSDKKWINPFIKKYTGFTPLGFVKHSNSSDYWCKVLKEDEEGILIQTN